MTDKELLKSDRQYDILGAIAVGFGVLLFGFIGYIALGIYTRVIGICSGASEGWIRIYDWLSLMIPIGAICAGLAAYKRFKRNRLKNSASKENTK